METKFAVSINALTISTWTKIGYNTLNTSVRVRELGKSTGKRGIQEKYNYRSRTTAAKNGRDAFVQLTDRHSSVDGFFDSRGRSWSWTRREQDVLEDLSNETMLSLCGDLCAIKDVSWSLYFHLL